MKTSIKELLFFNRNSLTSSLDSLPTLFEYLQTLPGDVADLSGKDMFSYLANLQVDYLANSQFGIFDYLNIPLIPTLSVSFAGGETTLTWTGTGDLTGCQFRIYKKAAGSGLITVSNFGTATLVTTLANNVFSYTFTDEGTAFLYSVAIYRGSSVTFVSDNVVNQQAVLSTINSSFNSYITTPYSAKIAATAYSTADFAQTLAILAEAVFMYTFEPGGVSLSSNKITAALPWKGALQATQSTTANQPILSSEGALFDGLNDVLSLGDNGDLTNTGNSIFALIKPNSLSVDQVVGGKSTEFAPALDGGFVLRISNSNYSYSVDLGTQRTTPTKTAILNERQTLVSRSSQAAGAIYIGLDGTATTFTAVSTNFNTTTPYMIGGRSSSSVSTNLIGANWFNGYMESYLHFSRPLSDTEANLVNSFLSNYKLG